MRKVVYETGTGPPKSERVHTFFTIRVTDLSFDAQASTLQVKGLIRNDNVYASIGQSHTLDLELNRKFKLTKDHWDSVALDLLHESVNDGGRDKGRQAYAVVLDDEGHANICILLFERTVMKLRVAVPIPRKKNAGQGKAAGSAHEKGIEKFFQTLMESMLRWIRLDDSLPILLASCGFTAQNFLKFLMDRAAVDQSIEQNKMLLKARDQFIVVHSSSSRVSALKEALQNPKVAVKLQDTKFAIEARLMDKFMELLRKDNGKAWYGPREVERAVEHGAVGRGGGVLLINNSLFRSEHLAVRKRWVALVDKVKEEGGEARILSSEHESGKRLDVLGGIAAILTYPMEDLDEGEEEEEVEEEEVSGEAEGDYVHRPTNEANGINNGVGENILS